MENKKNGALALLAVLPLIVLTCIMLWYVRNYYRVENMIRVKSDNGVFDLSGIDLDECFVRLEGDVLYLPGILTSSEFAARQDEAQSGNPWYLPSATSRIRIKTPADDTYMVTAASADFAHRVYVDGELRFSAGVPAETAAGFTPSFGQMTLELSPENGTIEMIQQSANFVHREGGGHNNLYFGKPKAIHTLLALTHGPEYICVGLLATLFLVHLILYIVRRSYLPNLIFSLMCLTWMVRTGVTGAKVFYAMFPALPWQLAFRAEYLSMPIATVLMILLSQEVFSGIPSKSLVRTVVAGSAVYSALCLVADTVFLSWAVLVFEVFFTLVIVCLCVGFIRKIPEMVQGGRFQIEQTVSLIGLGIFMAAAINDAMFHAGVFHALGFAKAFPMTWLAVLIFSFFQMTAMFYGTMRETILAHEQERKATAEREMLLEMNRMKNAFYADLSHEMKTPLTVIAVNAQFAAQNIGAGAVDEETVTDLNAISSEARRLAQMVTSLVGIGRLQGVSDERAALSLDSLVTETARIYQALFVRKGNTLTVWTAEELPTVSGNADQLIQVLINLLSNANRHTAGGAVELRAESLGSMVRVSVADTGEGIAPELLPYVFERYSHGAGGDLGLGLPICKTIIEEHGGRMGIESQLGKGTTVWFILSGCEE